MWGKDKKEYYGVNKWVGIFNEDYKEKGIKVNAHILHQLFGYYKIPSKRFNEKNEEDDNGKIVAYPVKLVKRLREYGENFLYIMSNFVNYGVPDGKEYYLPRQPKQPYKETEFPKESFKNDEDDMEKYSKYLINRYQIESKKTIKITESQYKKLLQIIK
jgi:hypothetical protein